jgi:hypothetical protein
MNVGRLVQQHEDGRDHEANQSPFQTPQYEHAKSVYLLLLLYSIEFQQGGAFFCRYSVRSATIGLTRVARRAGTKQEAAATAVSSPATTK